MKPEIGQRIELRAAGDRPVIARWWTMPDDETLYTEQPSSRDRELESGETETLEPIEHTVDVKNREGTITALDPGRGVRVDVDGDDVPAEIFFPFQVVRVPLGHGVFVDKADHDEWMADARAAFGELRALVGKAQRARIAETGADLFEFARGLGIDLPAVVRRALGAAAFFTPTLALMPARDGSTERRAIDGTIEIVDLLSRLFGVKGR